MEREDAIERLNLLTGKDLRKLADDYGVVVWVGEKKNKGWAGHVIERYLGLPQNSLQAPNFGSWELKIIPLKHRADNVLVIKETMAITMLDPYYVERTPFEECHLYAKIKKAIICTRIFESQKEERSLLYKVATFDLDNEKMLEQIREDYELVRRTIRDSGFESLTGKMGVFVQPRTKGPGHGSISRAFYARKELLRIILDLE